MKSRVLLESHLQSLKLPTFVREYERTARQCAQEDKDYAEFLLCLAGMEVAERQRKAVQRRLKQAGFPAEAVARPTAVKERHLQRLENHIFKRHLIIVDELGYVPLGQGAAENLFNFISRCYERTSLIVTTNLPFSERPQVLGDERMAGALLDRLTHRVHVLGMDGESYRLKAGRRAVRITAKENDSPEEE